MSDHAVTCELRAAVARTRRPALRASLRVLQFFASPRKFLSCGDLFFRELDSFGPDTPVSMIRSLI